MKRRTFAQAAALAAAWPALGLHAQGLHAQAKNYPARPIRLVVPFPPGGAVDILARRIGSALAEVLGGNVVVENRAGGGGTIAAQHVASSPPDGYTLLVGGLELATNPSLIGTKGINPERDLTPIAGLTLGTFVLAVNPAFNDFKTLRELLAAARAQPGKFTFGSAGVGNVTHLFGEIFKRSAQIDVRHIPYKGAAPAIADLQGGQITMMFASLATAKPLVGSGHLRALAITGSRTHPSFPGVDTFDAQDVPMPEVELGAWVSLFGPAGLPRELVTQINGAVNQVLATPAIRDSLAQIGLDVHPTTPARMAELLASQTQKWTQVIRSAAIKLD